MKDSSFLRIIAFCGSCIAFYIGAGFATMQEVMQYEASYGSLFMVVIAVAAAIYVYTNLSFTTNGSKHRLTTGSDVFTLYCGRYIGAFYKWLPPSSATCASSSCAVAQTPPPCSSGAFPTGWVR